MPSKPSSQPDKMPAPEKHSEQSSENQPTPGLGWTAYAEQLNGRFAMIGLVILLTLEFFTRQDFITWLGFR